MTAMAAERTSRPRRVGRMTRMPRVVSQAPQGHDHEARSPSARLNVYGFMTHCLPKDSMTAVRADFEKG
jgi:hypothetical protein